MSMELMVRAMKIRVGNPLRKLVLLKLADNANDVGECWPSYQHIADQCEVDRSTVRKHIKHLELQGLLTIVNRDGPKGNSSNLYYLTFDGVGAQPTGVDKKPKGVGSKSTGVGPQPTGVGPQPTPPVGPDSTRTSHAFDPVIEPAIEPLQPGADAPGLPVVVEQAHRLSLPADMPGPKDQDCKTFKAWVNYAWAYRKRYQAWPVWNARVGGQLGNLVNRLGIEVAHSVVAFYVSINDARLIRDCHSLNLLVRDAESYHTQWLTNRQVNGTTAQQIERKQANLSAGQEAAALIMGSAEDERNEFM